MFLEFAKEVAIETGDLLMERFGRVEPGRIGKKGRIDLVTEVDTLAEQHIRSRIQNEYPEHDIYGEETERLDRGRDFCWVIDPLDGTTNFVHSFPFFAVSIALLKRRELEVGVVHAPYLRETFWAIAGRGAYYNDERIRVSRTTDLVDSLLATGFAYRLAETPDTNIDNFTRLLLEAQGIRRAGSASIDLAYVACGRFDGFWELHLNPWDVAAGALLVAEAGGRVTDFAGGRGYLFGGNIVATNGFVHAPLVSRLAKIQEPELL
jgi:myo-inositol-1(or 4)-monophosphatase